VRAVTIRGKLFAAIALTVLGPLVTIGVAFAAFNSLGDRFDESQHRANLERRALDLKFAVTDMNGWQTAYGYDGGRSRARFVSAANDTRMLLELARGDLTSPRERALIAEIGRAYESFMALDERAWTALQAGRTGETKRILLGPEIRHFETMARAAGELAAVQDRRAAAAAREFEDARQNGRKQLVAVAIGAAVVIVLLLITLQDVVRLALERRGGREAA
jgi:hypothetical protein